MRYGIAMMVLGGVAIYAFAHPLMAAFTTDESVVRIGSDYLVIAAITLCSYVVLYTTVYMLQGLKRPMYAIWIGLYRQIVAPCIVFYILAYWMDWKLHGVWWGVFWVTWSAAIITYFYGKFVLRRVSAEGSAEMSE